jgi:hypothetical protein
MCVHAGGQTVRFKYLSKEDFQRVYGPNLANKSQLMAQWKVVGGNSNDPSYGQVSRDLGKVEHLERYRNKHLKDLEDRNCVVVLYKCYLRAREAAEKGAQFFQKLQAKNLPGAKGKYSAVRGVDQAGMLASFVLSEYFASADREEYLDEIRDTFKKTAQGLGGKDITISDCAGRERVGALLAEGIVPLRAGSHNELEKEAQSLDDLYEQRKGKLLKVFGEESSDRVKLQQWVDQQYLMKKYLESGDTKSIHIEYSYIDTYSIDAMARIFLHEATHKFAATADFGYATQDTIKSLRPDEAVKNADSYAYAGLAILKDAPITHRELNSEKPAAITETAMGALTQMGVVFGKGKKG